MMFSFIAHFEGNYKDEAKLRQKLSDPALAPLHDHSAFLELMNRANEA